MITRNVLRIVAAGAILGSPLTVIGVEAAGAETVLVSCTGVHSIITLNPTTGSGDACRTGSGSLAGWPPCHLDVVAFHFEVVFKA